MGDYTLKSERDDEIKADFVWVADMRGPGGLIIGDNGDYLFCQSAYGYDHWKEEYKKGTRTSNGTDENLKLQNGKYAEDQETKETFEGYMSKVDNYNEQVASGEKPEVRMGDLLNEYTDTFHDEALEANLKKAEEDYNNRETDTKIDNLITNINEKLNMSDDNKSTVELINDVNERIANVERQERNPVELVPDNLKDYVYFIDGKIYAKQKIPRELEEEYIKIENQINN